MHNTINAALSHLKNMPAGKRYASLCIIAAGIGAPIILVVSLLLTHGSIDYYFDYSPIRHAFQLLVFTGAIVFIAACIDLLRLSRNDDARLRFPGMVTLILAIVSIIVTLSATGFICAPQMLRSGDTPPQLILTESSDNTNIPGLAVVFWTNEPTVNTVRWGMPGEQAATLREENPSRQHRFQLYPLKPDTVYEYKVNDNESVIFKSPPSADKPLRFAASGDPHIGNSKSNNDQTRKMLQLISNPENNYSMLFLLGDLVDIGFFDSLWKRALTTMSLCSSSIPTYYVMGNHDALFGGIHLYRDYLCPPDENDNTRPWRWNRIDRGNIHFLILDLEWGMQLYTPEQHKWLVAQLESIPKNDWCIVMSHTFYYCSGSYQDGWEWYDNEKTIEGLVPLFEEYDVDLVLSGHKHHSELLEKTGVTYVVIGSFGGNPAPERNYTSPASTWYQQGNYAFLDVLVENNRTTVSFCDADNRVLHQRLIQP